MCDKKMFQRLIAVCMLTFILMPSITTVFGEEIDGKKYLNRGQMYSSCDTVTRTTKYTYVSFRCDSVYPETNAWFDTFTKMQARVGNKSYIGISSPVTFTELRGYGNIVINEGYLDIETIRVQVRGNNPDQSAWAVFTYKPN